MKRSNPIMTWTYGLELSRRRAVVLLGQRSVFLLSYGSPATGPTQYPLGSTPIHFGASQRISIAAPFAESGRVCLFYSQEEFEDVVSRICSCPMFVLVPAAREYLFSTTNGHCCTC